MLNDIVLRQQLDETWEKSPETTLQAENRDGYQWFRASFTNDSGKKVRFGGFRFDISVFDGIPGKRIRIYREGWTMASACGTVRYGEKDFELDPSYLKFSVIDAEKYDSGTPNKFSAEHVAVLNDRDTGHSLLTGFISSADQLTRISIELNADGIKQCSAYSCCDGIEVDPGETIHSEELVILDGDDGYTLLEQFADLWAKRMNALSWDHIPTGWCSWYYYFSNITEDDMIENLRFLSANKEEFPCEFFQLDDGYQAALGDWLTCNAKFPHGLEYLAKEATVAGFKPGVWLAPFMVEERSVLFAEHPEWLVKDVDGKIRFVSEWRGSWVAVLDGTHPEAQAYLTHVFSTLVDWGFEYVKLDFLSWACQGNGGCYYDRKATRAQALRRGLQAIRKGMGDRFMLGCTAPLGQIVGIMNGERIGTDIMPYWQPDRKIYKEAPTVPNVCRNIINRCYMNGRLWISDPDTHIARIDNNKLTEDEVILWTYALFMSGGMMLLSDRFKSLTPERAELSKLLLRNPVIPNTRPLDFFDSEYPAVWLRQDADKSYIGLFNLSDEERDIYVPLDKVAKDTVFNLTDFQTGTPLCQAEKRYAATLRPHSCQIIQLEIFYRQN